MRSDGFRRIWLFYILICATGAILITRLYFLQIVHGDRYADIADRQYSRTSNGFDRGLIFFQDRSGNSISAATVKSGFVLTINPTQITAPEATFESLSKIVALDRETFMKLATKAGDPYEELVHRLGSAEADQITKLGLPGVSLYKERWRYYPAESLAAHTLGFVGYKGDELVGRYGLESYYEDTLARTEEAANQSFLVQLFSDFGKPLFDKGSGAGDLYTSIDPTIQTFLEKKLASITSTHRPDLAGGIIMDPKTGEVVAMAATPSFNPNSYEKEKDPGIFTNPLVESVYEMGSIIKPLTMAAGIDTGKITPQTTYDDKGFLVLNTARISNFDGKGRGVVSMQEVLNQSLNTGVAFVVKTIGNKVFADYMEQFGIGEETGIDLPNETYGLIKNLRSTRDIEYATASYGQGIAMTPIETVRALSILANKGKLVSPRVGRKIVYKAGLSKDISIGEERQVLKPETAETITRMLVEVVDKALLHGDVKLPRYSVAAKTGTAQISNPAGGGYYKDRFLHSFFGYFPAYNPQYMVFYYTVNPRGVAFASESLTHPFIDTTKFLIQYSEIPPDR